MRPRRASYALMGLAFTLVVAACSGTTTTTTEALATTTSTESPLPRQITQTVSVGANGISEPVEVQVPPGSRSIFVSAVGSAADVVAIAALDKPDGSRVFDLDSAADVPALLEEVAAVADAPPIVPGDDTQIAGIGRFAWIDPTPPTAGPLSIRLASTGASLDVTLAFPPDDGSTRLHLDVFSVNGVDTLLDEDLLPLSAVSQTFAAAGIEVVWEAMVPIEVPSIVGAKPTSAADVEPLLADLVAAAQPAGHDDALDVFLQQDINFNEFFPEPMTPGLLPPDPAAGVIVLDLFRPQDTGFMIAHMVAHYLGLPHVETIVDDVVVMTDPFDDTESGASNLMDSGRAITPQQAAALLASPLIRD